MNWKNLQLIWNTIDNALSEQRSLSPRGPWVQKLARRCRFRLTAIYLLRYLRFQNPPINCLSYIRSLTSLLPLNSELQAAGLQLLKELNEDALHALSSDLSGTISPTIIVIGCRHRITHLRQTIRRFHQCDPSLRVIGVIGSPSLPDWCFNYDSNTNCLSIPVSDRYQSLPSKVAWACLALSMLPEVPHILKVDDDAIPDNVDRLRTFCTWLADKKYSAAGYPILTQSHLSLDRGWHIGKCDPVFNMKVFDGPSTRLWMSGGTGYVLTQQGVHTISAHALHSWGLIESMIYEDMAISLILRLAETSIYWLNNPFDLGVSTERSNEINDGHWAVDWHQLKTLS